MLAEQKLKELKDKGKIPMSSFFPDYQSYIETLNCQVFEPNGFVVTVKEIDNETTSK
jgi:hypothetical protein